MQARLTASRLNPRFRAGPAGSADGRPSCALASRAVGLIGEIRIAASSRSRASSARVLGRSRPAEVDAPLRQVQRGGLPPRRLRRARPMRAGASPSRRRPCGRSGAGSPPRHCSESPAQRTERSDPANPQRRGPGARPGGQASQTGSGPLARRLRHRRRGLVPHRLLRSPSRLGRRPPGGGCQDVLRGGQVQPALGLAAPGPRLGPPPRAVGGPSPSACRRRSRTAVASGSRSVAVRTRAGARGVPAPALARPAVGCRS